MRLSAEQARQESIMLYGLDPMSKPWTSMNMAERDAYIAMITAGI